ncbi:MAG: energy-coupling factor transporter transmembrane protein EcfT [Peptostreptococcaceae bacterium]|nr:energy-coupling factor transporter transmembrane protein EcfT [Peptostreptococcaceae bacterium]
MNKTSKDNFGTYHPMINFTYFCMVISFSMIFLHPVLMLISFTAAFTYSVYLNGKGAVKFNLAFVLPMMLVAAMVNPLFNHSGMTILYYFRDNPITLESIVYGLATGFMFGSVIIWFSCYNAVITSDKFIYIFGKIIPAMSLVFAMVLRFIPKFKAQIRIVSNGQKCIGRDITNGTLLQRLSHGIKIVSIMITWALENGIDTADSMRARGYGLPGRTSFSIFRFDSRDKIMGVAGVILLGVVVFAAAKGENAIQFFPYIKMSETSSSGVLGYMAYSMLCFGPMLIDLVDQLKWRKNGNC